MPKSKKKAHELTADEVMKRIFKPGAMKLIRKLAKKKKAKK